MASGDKTYLATSAEMEAAITKTTAAISDIGTLSSLSTTSKTNMVSAINEVYSGLKTGKSSLVTALSTKGSTVVSDPTFTQLTAGVNAITTTSTIPKAFNTSSSGGRTIYSRTSETTKTLTSALGDIIFTLTSKVYGRVCLEFQAKASSYANPISLAVDNVNVTASSSDMTNLTTSYKTFRYFVDVSIGSTVSVFVASILGKDNVSVRSIAVTVGTVNTAFS